MRLGLISPRYGADIAGGAEVLCGQVAGRLAGALAGRGEVEVISTTARDYTTWANHYPAGLSQDGLVRVRRFPVARQRRLRLFDLINRLTARFNGRAPSLLERIWVFTQGPRVPGLLTFLRAEGSAFDRLVFFTYLYEPTVLGLPRVRERAWLVPTAHDEPALNLRIIRPVFESARALGFLSPAEESLVLSRFAVAGTPRAILGAGVEAPAGLDPAAFARQHSLGRYLLYLGRIDFHKGLPELLEFWPAVKAEFQDLSLVLAGEEKMDLPQMPGLVRPGFLSQADKWSALSGALALVAPSRLESLNLTVLEAGAAGRPVLVNGRGQVLAEYVRRSGAGLAYDDRDSFLAGLRALSQEGRADEMGLRGRALADGEFSWPKVEKRWLDWLEL